VYYYDQAGRQWKPMDSGLSRVDVYQNSQTGIWRIVAIDQKNPSNITINSTLFKELVYQKASDLFHQWTDTRNSYGLNFASRQEADSFAATVTDCINKLKAGITAAASASSATTESAKSNETSEKKTKKPTKSDKDKKSAKKKPKEGKKKGHKKEPSEGSAESQGSTEAPAATAPTEATASSAQPTVTSQPATTAAANTSTAPLASPHSAENKPPASSLAEQLAKVKLNETPKETTAQREAKVAPAADLNSELANKLKQRQSAIAEKTTGASKETSNASTAAPTTHTPQTSTSSSSAQQPSVAAADKSPASVTSSAPTAPVAVTKAAGNAPKTTGVPSLGLSAKGAQSSTTQTSGGVTREDLEHFKQEILSYIDKVKQEILEAIQNRNERESGGNDEE
jgi:hypothetical protein